MKKLSLLVLLVGLSVTAGVAQTRSAAVASRDNVTTHSMGNDRKSYSPLKQVNRANVKRLVPLWTTSLWNETGELAAPAIADGVMYVINGRWTFAFDVRTGRQIWRTPVVLEQGTVGATITRGGPVLYNGKLFRVTYDNHLLALDMKDGKEIWNQKFADKKDGYYATGAPMVANGVVISGMSGGERTTRGFLDGWDPDTGKKLWRRYTIPAPGEPGSETWPKDSDAWMYGGGPTWRTGSYDPDLDLVYWGTGNAEPYDPHSRGGMDSLFTSSVLAIRPKTGEVACSFQFTPNDVYDVDGTDEFVLAEMTVSGRPRKVMIQANKNGFLYVLDRTNCQLIAANPYVKVNWASHIDLESGRPVLTDVYKRFFAGEEVEIWPSRGTNAVPIALDPSTGVVFASTWNVPRVQRIAAPKPQVLGADSTGVTAKVPDVKSGDIMGYFVALNPLTGEKKWEVPLPDLPASAGMLATGGGLVFTGKLTGEFLALDSATGKTLWQFQTGSSVNATAITYTYEGRQYVSVASGRGGQLANRYAAEKVPAGGAVWTFALP